MTNCGRLAHDWLAGFPQAIDCVKNLLRSTIWPILR
jgi:hypothetical protein